MLRFPFAQPMLSAPTLVRRFLQDLRAIPPLHWLLYGVIALGCALRVSTIIVHNPMDHLWSDPLRHWDHARQPLVPMPMAIFDPPAYQTFLSLIQRATFGVPGLVAFYISALSLLGPWCWYRFIRETLASRSLALAGWAILAALPSWIGIYSYFMTETLFLPTLGAGLWFTARAHRKKDFRSFLAMVAVWLLCGLTRPVAIPSAAFAAGFVWLWHPQKWRTALASLAMLGVVLIPLAIRNHHFYGLWAPHGNGWLNKIYAQSGARTIELHFSQKGATWTYGFGSPSIDSHPLAPLSNWTSSRSGSVVVNVDFDHGSRDWESAYAASAKHGAAVWQLRAENLVFLFFGDSWPDNNNAYFIGWLSNLSRWLWAPCFAGLLIASFYCWRTVRQRPLLPIVIATWLFFQGCLLVVPNEGRYRKPMEGLFVAYALTLFDARVRARRTIDSLPSQKS